MFSFVIKRKKKWKKIDEALKDIEGFKYNSKVIEKYNIDNLNIVKPELISNLIINNFDKKYKKILEVYLKAIEADDDTTGGMLMMSLDEVARLRTIIINKYNKVLKRKEIENLLKKLKIIENEIRIKIIDYKLMAEQKKVPDIEKGKGR